MACILLVDDTETYLSLEQRVLGPAHRYLLARNGQQALSLARTGRPDLIVMDLSMPLMPGDEAIHALHLDPSTAAIPVIALTAESAYEAIVQNLGCADFIRKPFEEDDFKSRVIHVLNAGRAAGSAVLVKVGRQAIAIPLEAVRQVVSMPALAPLPGAPRHIKGLLNLRGKMIPVFDLPARLNLTAAAQLEDQLLVVCEREGRPLAVCVDDAEEVVEIARSSFAPLNPEIALTLGSLSRAFLGGWKSSESLVPVLAPFRLLPDSTFEQLGELD
jgi:chemotaxis signal transduction protein